MKKFIDLASRVYLTVNIVLGICFLLLLLFPSIGVGVFCEADGFFGLAGCTYRAMWALFWIIPTVIIFRFLISRIAEKDKLMQSTKKDYILLFIIFLFSSIFIPLGVIDL